MHAPPVCRCASETPHRRTELSVDCEIFSQICITRIETRVPLDRWIVSHKPIATTILYEFIYFKRWKERNSYV